jgi:endonuclease/exonuclease/phosphatase family metal-dependent hydrolase
MKKRTSLLIALCTLSVVFTAEARTLTVTSFNIKIYGQKSATQETPTLEQRNSALKKFIEKDVPASDVMIFEEIMDKEALFKGVVSQYQCVSYDNARVEHQYVVVCAKAPFKLKMDKQNDDNYALEDVQMGSTGQRPAVHALVVDEKDNALLRVFGVHLSAFPNKSENRVKQAEIISAHLKKADNKIPSMITGDFNTYPASLTGLALSDVELISEVWAKNNIVPASHPEAYTFRSPEFRSKFDHFWISKSLNTKKVVKVSGVCNSENDDETESVKNYYRLVSDHCPVSLSIDVKDY